MEKTYEMGGKKYIQRPLVLGQIQQLIPLLQNIDMPKGADAVTIANVMGASLPRALAIALLEAGVDEPEPDKMKAAMDRLEERAVEIQYSIKGEQIFEVIEDFFACNRASSILERLGSLIRSIREQFSQMSAGLSKRSGDSPEGTSRKGKNSSGA